MVITQSLRRKLTLAVTLAVTGTGILTASPAMAATAGIVPPRKPKTDCAGNNAWVNFGISNINACRAKEGVGRVRLPSNWKHLNPVQQQFVLINLERVNRGLKPVVGLSGPLNTLVQRGAVNGTDPSFPSHGFVGGGAIWAASTSVAGAVDSWMYYDGPHGLDLNAACTNPTASGCWLHRDIILWGGTGGPLVGGGGYSRAPGYRSYSFEILSGYSTSHLTFRWSHELHFFGHHRPRISRLHGRTAKAGKKHHHRKHHHKRSHRRHGHHHHKKSGSTPTITIG